ncbi:hypothetical protein CPT_Mater21 [Bacillus phage Mater]|uniref:Uncharacterized protein n=1 Tax=Bacillus phage Mater TaxID=1540090 RepID=A0A0A0RUE7_9CAUD|nr:hypothetical protein CPT_Mater21 [Bacillus phage Mater]AIW03178.1 hypothetical protein CPT_Mater21 [Bacillus phage Mater]
MTAEEKLQYIKDEIETLITVEDNKRAFHKHTGNEKSEYFYRGRIAYMKHLRNFISKLEIANGEYDQ